MCITACNLLIFRLIFFPEYGTDCVPRLFPAKSSGSGRNGQDLAEGKELEKNGTCGETRNLWDVTYPLPCCRDGSVVGGAQRKALEVDTLSWEGKSVLIRCVNGGTIEIDKATYLDGIHFFIRNLFSVVFDRA